MGRKRERPAPKAFGPADLEIGDTAGLETCATHPRWPTPPSLLPVVRSAPCAGPPTSPVQPRPAPTLVHGHHRSRPLGPLARMTMKRINRHQHQIGRPGPHRLGAPQPAAEIRSTRRSEYTNIRASFSLSAADFPRRSPPFARKTLLQNTLMLFSKSLGSALWARLLRILFNSSNAQKAALLRSKTSTDTEVTACATFTFCENFKPASRTCLACGT